MKFATIIVASISALVLFDQISAQIISPGVPPILPGGFGAFPGMFPGFLPGLLPGLLPFGPLGLLGGLGLGLGSFGPLGGFGIGRARMFGVPRGKRSVNETAHGEFKCALSKDLITCTGPREIVECRVEPHTPISLEQTRLKSIELTFKEKIVNNVPILKVVPKKLINRLGHKTEHISLYESKSLIQTEPGFRVTDPVCFNEIFTLVKELPEKVKLIVADFN